MPVHGYTLYNGKLINIRRVIQTELPSHYGIFSTVTDLAKWDAALYGEKLLKRASLDQMWTPVKLNNGATYAYGFAWDIEEQHGHRAIGHTGITGTQITRYPDDKLTVIVLTNLGTWGIPATSMVHCWGMTKTIATYYIPGLAYRPIPDTEPQVTALARAYFTKRVLPEPDESLFTPEFLPTVKSVWKQSLPMFQSLGPVQSVQLVERKQEGANRLYRYRIVYKERTRLALFTLNKDGKIASVPSEDE